jgi:poly(hydroxyalkanoate) depolymerase family esterase
LTLDAKKQSQPLPGLASKMDPRPDHGETSYKGSGRLAGRKALVTGGDSGMGRAAAIAYAREGADVAINYFPTEEPDAKEVIDPIKAEGRVAVAIPGDLRDEKVCQELVARAIEGLGRLDNAGRQQAHDSILDISSEDFDATMKTNIYAPFWIIKAALPHLKPGSVIIGTTSELAYDPTPDRYDYPAQRGDANQAKCWNWFRTADQRRGEGEPSLIAGITRQGMRDYSVDPKRVYVGGLSAGAAAAAIMGATYNDLYAAVGIHSGLACGAATDMPSAFAAMRQGGGSGRSVISGNRLPVPAIIFHGDRDATVHPNNGDQVLEQAMGTTSTQKKVHRGQIPGGHAYTRTTHIDAGGRKILEHWNIHGAGHAWSGGCPAGSYTDPQGPDATREMLRFFLSHSLHTS